MPVLDGRWFESVARALARGEALAELASGFRSLFYPALLAPLYALFGGAGIVAAQLLQHAAGVLSAVAAALLARRIFDDERAALAAGLLYAAAPVPLYFEGELLAESLFCAVVAGLLLTLAGREEIPGSTARLALAGGLLAVASQLRPNALLLLAALPFALRRGRSSGRATAVLVASCVLGAAVLALALLPATGTFRLLPASGGVNLYLGNERGADGLVPRQDFAVSHGEEYLDSVELFAVEAYRREQAVRGAPAGRQPTAGEIDRYWLGRAAREVAADPVGRAALLARKAIVLLWNGEVPNNKSYAFVAREESRILRLLPARFALLFALALAGVATSRAGPARFWTLAFAFTHGAGVVLYFVADRYRLPLYLPAAVFAGGGVAALARALRAPRPAGARRAVALAAAGALVSAIDWTGASGRLPGPERDLHFRSIARLETGDIGGALADASRAARLAPGSAEIWAHLGTAALAAGELERAEPALARALVLDPAEPRVRNALGVAAERRGRPDEARRRYGEALELAPRFAPALLNAAWLELRAGRPADAATLAARLPRDAEPTVQALVLRAALAREAGDFAEADRLRAAARRMAPDAAAELERELSAPSPSRP